MLETIDRTSNPPTVYLIIDVSFFQNEIFIYFVVPAIVVGAVLFIMFIAMTIRRIRIYAKFNRIRAMYNDNRNKMLGSSQARPIVRSKEMKDSNGALQNGQKASKNMIGLQNSKASPSSQNSSVSSLWVDMVSKKDKKKVYPSQQPSINPNFSRYAGILEELAKDPNALELAKDEIQPINTTQAGPSQTPTYTAPFVSFSFKADIKTKHKFLLTINDALDRVEAGDTYESVDISHPLIHGVGALKVIDLIGIHEIKRVFNRVWKFSRNDALKPHKHLDKLLQQPVDNEAPRRHEFKFFPKSNYSRPPAHAKPLIAFLLNDMIS